MSRSVRKKEAASKAPPKADDAPAERKRPPIRILHTVGPEQHAPAERELVRTGRLFRKIPGEIRNADTGEVLSAPGYHLAVSHPAFSRLREAARALGDVARSLPSPEAAAAGHIAQAIVVAIESNDLDALNAESGPHTWARRYLRAKHKAVLPVEDAKGRLLKDPRSIVAGFRRVERILKDMIEAGREERPPTYPAPGEWLVHLFVFNFPSISTLAGKDYGEWAEIEKRIAPQYRQLVNAKFLDRGPNVSGDILESILETECKLSGWSPTEIRKAFHFRDS